ncbi:MAG: metal ABC transporter ATP-binding protein [Firmicutes bacterium]|nr:metal ABC transporter ATP-binding protein [Bacillota bacterium]
MEVENLGYRIQSLACGLCCTRLENFGVTRGRVEVLRDINLHIHCGELTALIGPNGAGKSTLLKAILGELPHSGQLVFLDSHDRRTRKPLVGYVPQRLEFDSGSPISVIDLFTASISRTPVWFTHPGWAREKAGQALASLNAEYLLDRRLGDLSGGELQRVLLALALEPVPDLLLMDEPVAGVDQSGLELFYRMVSDLRQRYDLSIIMVSHDLQMIPQYADRVVFLNRTVLSVGKPLEVLSDPKVVQTFGPVWPGEITQTELSRI